ncbi:hypothetical protein L2D00_02935 [Hyphomonadaceae bacterium BL14]|nr:hypothetical protein L2D00_02935 [Hyphomonadaceae bacterium BL14]
MLGSCLCRLLDELQETGKPRVITRHGKPVATIYGTQAPGAARGVSDGDRRAPFGNEPVPQADPYAEAKAMLKADPDWRKLSGPELVAAIKALQADMRPDPVLDAMSWEERKELIRS